MLGELFQQGKIDRGNIAGGQGDYMEYRIFERGGGGGDLENLHTVFSWFKLITSYLFSSCLKIKIRVILLEYTLYVQFISAYRILLLFYS